MAKIYFDVYVVKLTEENIPQIIEATEPLGWTLDHIEDNARCNAEYDDASTVLFLKLYRGTTEIATFLDEPVYANQPETYIVTDEIDPKFGIFHKIQNL